MLKRFGSVFLAMTMMLGLLFASVSNASAANEYTVKAKDNLWKIAKEYYGDGAYYKKILDANKDIIKNPNLIYPGQVLIIPDADITSEPEAAPAPETIPAPSPAEAENSDEAIYIVYTNDVHSYIYNTNTTEDGEEVAGLRLSNVAAYVEDLKKDGKNVLLVDAGDEVQGNVYGAFDSGESVIKLMNVAGYDLATIGNHEFDYGMFTLFNRIEEANYPYVTCSFHYLEGEDPFEPYKIFDIGGKKVAFIGITTPDTTPVYFKNEAGQFIYEIDGLKDRKDLYTSVQAAVDKVRGEADYVIALGHLGIDKLSINAGISSYDVIANVTGLDAFIDGHSHSTVESELVSDKDGKSVMLTQTGSYLKRFGLMKISADGISSELIGEYKNSSENVAALEEEVYKKVEEEMGEVIGSLENTLYIYDPENPEVRIIRSQETNAGDLIADSTYWLFNNKIGMDCDIALANGGGIRAQLESKDITYLDTKSVQPFGNMICLVEASGKDILNAIEMGASMLGIRDEENNKQAENGGFLHVAGMKYSVDTSIPCSVKTDDSGMFLSVDGDYRVKDVFVYDRVTEDYQPLDLDKAYRIGGINYILRNGGNGLSMFINSKAVVDFVDLDYLMTADYLKAFIDADGSVKINTANSPLKDLPGYLIDYENPFGSGRITID